MMMISERMWKAACGAMIAVPCVTLVARGNDEPKKSEAVTVVTVVSADDDAADAKAKVATTKRMVLQAVNEGLDEIVDQVRKQLDQANLDEKTRDKVMEALKKALADRKGGKQGQVRVEVHADSGSGESTVHVDEANSRVLMIDQDGVKREFQLKRGTPMFWSGDGQFFARRLGSGLREEVLKRLLENGIDRKIAEKVAESFQKSSETADEKFGEFRVTMAQPKYRLGIALNPSDDGKMVVSEVMEQTPAAKAGVRPGDIVISANGQEISDASGLIAVVQEAGEAEKEVTLTIKRGDEELALAVSPQKAETALSGINEELQTILRSIPKGPEGGLVLPKAEGDTTGFFGGLMPGAASKEMKELRSELESLKSELAEIKDLLRELKK